MKNSKDSDEMACSRAILTEPLLFARIRQQPWMNEIFAMGRKT